MARPLRSSAALSCLLLLGISLPLGASLAGCQLFAAMEESRRRTSTRPVDAEYEGLQGKTFAVVIAADRAIVSEHGQLVEFLATKITERLSVNTNVPAAKGYVPVAQVLSYQYRTPGWAARAMPDLAKDLGGVDRIILVEVTEYRLNEPGNSYEWRGNATFTTSVFEIDGPSPDEPAMTKIQTVDFPDQAGVATDTLDRRVVTSALAARVIDRVSWLFYRHEEPYYPEY